MLSPPQPMLLQATVLQAVRAHSPGCTACVRTCGRSIPYQALRNHSNGPGKPVTSPAPQWQESEPQPPHFSAPCASHMQALLHLPPFLIDVPRASGRTGPAPHTCSDLSIMPWLTFQPNLVGSASNQGTIARSWCQAGSH